MYRSVLQDDLRQQLEDLRRQVALLEDQLRGQRDEAAMAKVQGRACSSTAVHVHAWVRRGCQGECWRERGEGDRGVLGVGVGVAAECWGR